MKLYIDYVMMYYSIISCEHYIVLIIIPRRAARAERRAGVELHTGTAQTTPDPHLQTLYIYIYIYIYACVYICIHQNYKYLVT